MKKRHGGVWNTRNGSAMVELVLGMFPLILMLGLLLWISQFAWQLPSHQCDVRNKAWSQRYAEQGATSRVFDFQSRASIDLTEQTKVKGIGPAFDRFPDISARNLVFASSWDHRQLKLDRPPHWNLAKELAVTSQSEKLRGLAGTLPPNLGAFQNAIRQDALSGAESLASADSLLEQLKEFLPGILSRNSDRLEEAQREAQRAKEEFLANRPPLVAETLAARKRLSELDRVIQQRTDELEEERRNLASAKEADKKSIQEKIDRLNDEVLPQLRKDRINLMKDIEVADQKLKDFDSLEPPPIN